MRVAPAIEKVTPPRYLSPMVYRVSRNRQIPNSIGVARQFPKWGGEEGEGRKEVYEAQRKRSARPRCPELLRGPCFQLSFVLTARVGRNRGSFAACRRKMGPTFSSREGVLCGPAWR